jgi:hypothetical protein
VKLTLKILPVLSSASIKAGMLIVSLVLSEVISLILFLTAAIEPKIPNLDKAAIFLKLPRTALIKSEASLRLGASCGGLW